jgi:beta-phosphoglucomutase-like phosphatase (HAD superfamily)
MMTPASINAGVAAGEAAGAWAAGGGGGGGEEQEARARKATGTSVREANLRPPDTVGLA